MEISLGSVLNTVGDRHTASLFMEKRTQLKRHGPVWRWEGSVYSVTFIHPRPVKAEADERHVCVVCYYAVSAAVREGEKAEVKQFVK